MYNVVAMNAIGDKYSTVYEKANTVRTLIGDIELNGNLTEAEKLQRIAAIYNDAEFRSLMSAMNGASNCFFSRQNDIFSNDFI